MNNLGDTRAGEIIQTVTVDGVVKIFFIAGLLMYCLFAAVVVRQVGVMEETIEARYNKLLELLAWLHLSMAIGIVVVAIIIL